MVDIRLRDAANVIRISMLSEISLDIQNSPRPLGRDTNAVTLCLMF